MPWRRFRGPKLRSYRVRDREEAVLDPEPLREQVAEPPDAERLGGPVAAGDEVHAGLARVRHAGLRRLPGEEGVEPALDRLGEAARAAARHDAHRLDPLGPAVEHERLALERPSAAVDQLVARDRLGRAADEADRPAVQVSERLGARQPDRLAEQGVVA